MKYRIEGNEEWNYSDDTTFVVEGAGIYEIKIYNGNIESDETPYKIRVSNLPKGFMEENTEYKDPDGDIAIIPEGFKISDDSKVIIDEGIVIEDENGNEFVWVPVKDFSQFVRMAGNVREWTMEWYSNTLRAYRGGVSTDDGATYPASYRIGGSPTNIDGYIGFRIALFLEDRSKLPEEIPNITFTYNPPLEKMTNENVIVTANTNSIKYTVETSKNGIDWDSASSLTYEKNGEVFARLMNEGTQVYFETEIEDWEYDVIITAKDAAGNESSCREIICFVAGTKVHTEEGLKNIEEIKVGEKVYTQNLENNTVELKEVKSVFESTAGEMCTVYVEDEEITSTLSHPYYVVDRGWVEAGQLQKGDKLLDSEGRAVEINKVEKFKLKEKIKVYNLSVEDHNNYFVTKHKLLVHNQGCGEQ